MHRDFKCPKIRGTSLTREQFLKQLGDNLKKLTTSIDRCADESTVLKNWSLFIKFRDGYKCLKCFAKKKHNNSVHAHHVFRKTTVPVTRFYTGNGITLCEECHRNIHKHFNRKPDISQVFNAEGGDDPDYITENFFYMIRDAKKRNIYHDNYYFVGEDLITISKTLQSIEAETDKSIPRIGQLFWVWRQCPSRMYEAVMNANGGSLAPPFDEGMTIYIKDDGFYITFVDSGQDFDIINRGSMTTFNSWCKNTEEDLRKTIEITSQLSQKFKLPFVVKDMRESGL